MSDFARAQNFAAHITDPQRTVLLADNINDIEAGIGTWMLLKQAGIVDGLFNLTEFGREVRHILQTETANV